MICPNCGKEYNEKMTCCISCGSPLVAFEQDTDQVIFEPLIPEAVPADESIDVKSSENISQNGFVRVHEKNSGNSSETVEELPEDTIPVRVTGERKSSSPKAAVNILSFAAAAMMFAFILLAAASLTARLITDSKKISEFAADLDVMNLPAVRAGMTSYGGYDIADDATVLEAVFIMSEGTGLTRDDIRKIYENSTASEFLASQLGGYASFIREGEMPEKLTSEKLKAVFSENIDLISESIGKPLSMHDIDLAFSELDRAEPVLEAIAPAKLEGALGDGALTAVRLFSSLPVIISESIAAAVMLVVLRALNKRPERVLGWGGGAVLAGGAAILLVSFLCSVQVFFTGQDRFVRSIVKSVTDVISPDLYRLGGILAALGAVMLMGALTIRKIRTAK